jgi:hypothetical protein
LKRAAIIVLKYSTLTQHFPIVSVFQLPRGLGHRQVVVEDDELASALGSLKRVA